jgi:hypothetical protein
MSKMKVDPTMCMKTKDGHAKMPDNLRFFYIIEGHFAGFYTDRTLDLTEKGQKRMLRGAEKTIDDQVLRRQDAGAWAWQD